MTMKVDDEDLVHTMRFGSLRIQYDDAVLVPRAWTAQQSYWAAQILRDGPSGGVLELCAGVGHIGLLSLAPVPREAVLVDIDPRACAHARANIGWAGLDEYVEVRQADVTEAVRPGEMFALAIIDPPWVPSGATEGYPEDPLLAIDGGADGLAVARDCLSVVAECLRYDGAVLLQLGSSGQAERIESWLSGDATPALRVDAMREYEGQGVLLRLSAR